MDKYLHICGSLQTGGITNIVKGLIKQNECSSSSHYIAVFKYNPEDQGKYVINLSDCRTNPLKALRFAYQTKSTYQKVFIHSADYLLMVAFFLVNVDCYFFQHGMTVSHGSKLKRRLRKYWFSILPVIFNTKVLCSSTFAAQKSRSLGIKLPDKRIEIVQFGTEIKRREGISVRKQNQPLVIGTAGRLAEIKRFDLLLESLVHYSLEQELEIRIAGDGLEKDKLIRLSEKTKSPKVKVKFLGFIDDMESFYDELDLFLFPSHNESYGLVVLEALYRNTPVAVFNDIGGSLHLIENGKNGFVLDEIGAGFCELWRRLNENPEQLETMKNYIAGLDLKKYHISETRKIIEQMN